MRKQNLPLQRLMTHDALIAVAQDLHHQDISALYAAVGDGHTSAQNVIEHLVALMGGHQGAEEDLADTPITLANPTRPSSGFRRHGPGRPAT